MSAQRVTVSACREYIQPAPCEAEGCEDPYHPTGCPDVEPYQWSEWIDPETASYCGGWYTDPEVDSASAMGQGERVELELAPWAAAELVAEWHGAVWDIREGEAARSTAGSWAGHRMYSTEDYRTGRESVDTLFISGSDNAVRLTLAAVDLF